MGAAQHRFDFLCNRGLYQFGGSTPSFAADGYAGSLGKAFHLLALAPLDMYRSDREPLAFGIGGT